jgi:hypothetical protein
MSICQQWTFNDSPWLKSPWFQTVSNCSCWQSITTTGMSFKAIGRQMDYHSTVVSRQVRKHTQTNNVKDLPRSVRPRVTSDRDDMALQRERYTPKPLLSLHRKEQLAGCSLGYRLYFCVSKPSSGRRFSIASGMAAAITTRHPTSNWRDETQGLGRHPSTWGLHPVLNFEQ